MLSPEYDRLVLSIGLPADDLGQPKLLAPALRFTPIEGNLRMVGLEAEGGLIRALGACATMYPGDPDFSGNAYLRTQSYFESLPVSAVLPGFIFNAANIAEANQYFNSLHGGKPHSNLNTLTEMEIKDRLVEKLGFMRLGEIMKAAEGLVAERRARNGYATRQEVRARLGQIAGLGYADEFNDVVAATLDTRYPDPLDFWD
jgi:hypothetical protein